MRTIVGLVTLSIVLAIIKAALVALVAAMMLALLWSFITQPRQTLVLLASLGVIGLANAKPLACIVALGVIGVAVVVAGARQKPRLPLLLTNGREHP